MQVKETIYFPLMKTDALFECCTKWGFPLCILSQGYFRQGQALIIRIQYQHGGGGEVCSATNSPRILQPDREQAKQAACMRSRSARVGLYRAAATARLGALGPLQEPIGTGECISRGSRVCVEEVTEPRR